MIRSEYTHDDSLISILSIDNDSFFYKAVKAFFCCSCIISAPSRHVECLYAEELLTLKAHFTRKHFRVIAIGWGHSISRERVPSL